VVVFSRHQEKGPRPLFPALLGSTSKPTQYVEPLSKKWLGHGLLHRGDGTLLTSPLEDGQYDAADRRLKVRDAKGELFRPTSMKGTF